MGFRPGRLLAAMACLCATLFIGACHVLQTCDEEGCKIPHGTKVVTDPSVMALAHDLDKLEQHIELYGSVVPKVPDVWGQARLTRHREEFEEQMVKDLGAFDVRINGALSRVDSAFFSQAMALGAAAQPRRGLLSRTRTLPGGGTETTSQQVVLPPPAIIQTSTSTGTTPAVTVTAPTGASGIPAGQTVIQTPAPVVATVSGPEFLATSGTSTFAERSPAGALSLEPAIVLEQKARYLNLLNQIRRTNEGDDTADAPGYSLNLVRIPVSILPGKKTDVGHGAEVTFTLTPGLGEDLLPSTFRTLIINDVADQLAFPLVRFLEDGVASRLLTRDNLQQVIQNPENPDLDVNRALADAPARAGKVRARQEMGALTSRMVIKSCLQVPSLAPVKGLQGRTAIPNSQILDVYGAGFCFQIGFQARMAFDEAFRTHGYVHLPDVQSFLLSELNASYRFLAEPANQGLWVTFCTPDLVRLIRDRDYTNLAIRRDEFRAAFTAVSSRSPTSPTPQALSITSALAWCLLVDAALLTDRLVLDMKETATAKGCAPFCGGWLDFYMPCPSAEARQAFNAYVACRWPVRVFALDPASQDQNLVDELATRRETQLALSLAFVSGQISANAMTRYARRLDANYETIALNRTQVGFSHGENTFGWRFMPRFQTPDTESNLTVLFRDQLIGGPRRDALLRQRRLEPGPRECVAIVLMPSFVPTLLCDSVSNWFDLANPKHKKFDHTDAMKASRAVKALQVHGPNVGDADCYRAGDFPRLLRRIEQLEARLPTQTATVPVPVINTLGGFKLFNNGTTDLAPELHGFYGAPGARTTSTTTLFLVGDHFSPLHTKVIVGNQECRVQMLSRQVIKVVVQPVAAPTKDNYLHAHVATPYGVSREIEIPVVAPAESLGAEMSLDTDAAAWTLTYQVYDAIVKGSDGKDVLTYRYRVTGARPAVANLTWVGALKDRPEAIEVKIVTNVVTPKIDNLTSSVVVRSSGGFYPIPVPYLFDDLVTKVNAAIATSPKPADPRIGPDGPAVNTTITVTKVGTTTPLAVYNGPTLYLNRGTPGQPVLPAPVPVP